MKTKLLRLSLILITIFWVSLSSKAQGTVNVHINEIDANGDLVFNNSHCPGEVVRYRITNDHYDVFKTRLYVENGTITDYTHTSNSQLISSTEVLLQPESGAMGYNDALVKITWNSAASLGKLHAVAYYHYLGFLFTQQADGYKDVTLTPGLPATPTQQTYYTCSGSSFSISFTLPPAASSSNWSLPDANWRVNGGQGVNGVSSYNVGGVTTVTISVPPGVPTGYYEVHTSSAGPCGTLGYRSIPVVIGSPSTTVDGETQANWTYAYVYSVPNSFGSGYNWSVPTGWTILSGQGTASIYARAPRFDVTGDVTVTYTDQCGGSTTAVTTVDNTKFQCRCLPQKASSSTIELYPNPVADQLNITLNESGPFIVTVRNDQGKVISELHGEGTGQFNTSKWVHGTYYLDITDATGKITKHRIIK